MRIKKLIIDAFGHFKDKEFDFGERRPERSDFHIIYGANETGKTTIMAAWLRFLFGIGKNEPYSFFHGSRQNLRISAVLEDDGAEKFIARLPRGHGSALIDEKGADLGERALQPYLRGISEKDYHNLLCLDGETVEAGGREILEAEGEMGAMLFSAASGLMNFSKKLDALEEEAGNIYKPRGSNNKFAGLKREYGRIEEQIKEKDIRAPEYEALLNRAAQRAEEVARCDAARRASGRKYELLSELERAQKNLRDSEAELREVIAEAKAAREALGILPERGAAEADAGGGIAETYQALADFSLSPEQIEALEKLNSEMEKMRQIEKSAAEELAELEKDKKSAESRLNELCAALPDKAGRESLFALIAECESGDIAALLKTAKKQTEDAERNFARALVSLSKNGKIFRSAPVCSFSAKDIDELARRQERAENSCKAAQICLRDDDAALASVNQQLNEAMAQQAA